MKKALISYLTLTALVLSPCALRADSPPESDPIETPTDEAPIESPEPESPEPIEEPEEASVLNEVPEPEEDEGGTLDLDDGTPVGPLSSDGAKAARKQMWQNIMIAVVSVAVAVTALILVSNNKGKKA